MSDDGEEEDEEEMVMCVQGEARVSGVELMERRRNGV